MKNGKNGYPKLDVEELMNIDSSTIANETQKNILIMLFDGNKFLYKEMKAIDKALRDPDGIYSQLLSHRKSIKYLFVGMSFILTIITGIVVGIITAVI